MPCNSRLTVLAGSDFTVICTSSSSVASTRALFAGSSAVGNGETLPSVGVPAALAESGGEGGRMASHCLVDMDKDG